MWLADTCDTDSLPPDNPRDLVTRSESMARRKREQAISRVLVRHALSRYCEVRFGDWKFIYNAHGRPEIAPGLTSMPLRFNVSHTAGLIACGVTLSHDIGVDVESIDAANDGEHLARRYFAPQEALNIASEPLFSQRELFLSYWTLKEAFLKAVGRGLSVQLDKVRFRFDGTKVGVDFNSELGEEPSTWQFEHYRPTARHYLALAVRCGRGVTVRVQGAWVSLDQLRSAGSL